MVYGLQDAVRGIWRWFKRLGALTLLGLLVLAIFLVSRLNIDRPETFADPVAQFVSQDMGKERFEIERTQRR